MHSKFIAAFVISCMTAFVSASPVPISPPLDVEARNDRHYALPREAEALAAVVREPTPEPAPEADPGCRWQCI
ncbi:hypothetical protein BDZ94DRAFT_1305944 [Collybia nuda]|uniref:Uncharacterized protein n=1 Tax=Collybia nuda TaxID=64659 RepID=A0A9P5YDL5_9AGAR|nr:hypothetical protein BDZ94DRAFT_1305944 [Collybia nuda]